MPAMATCPAHRCAGHADVLGMHRCAEHADVPGMHKRARSAQTCQGCGRASHTHTCLMYDTHELQRVCVEVPAAALVHASL